MQLTEQETEMLIREASNGRVLPLEFGPGFVSIKASPAGQWARERVQEMRALVAAEAGN